MALKQRVRRLEHRQAEAINGEGHLHIVPEGEDVRDVCPTCKGMTDEQYERYRKRRGPVLALDE